MFFVGASMTHEGTYRCIAQNPFGTIERKVNVKITGIGW